MGPPFSVPCEGLGPRFLHHSFRESSPGPARGSQLHYGTAAPRQLLAKESGPLDPCYKWALLHMGCDVKLKPNNTRNNLRPFKL